MDKQSQDLLDSIKNRKDIKDMPRGSSDILENLKKASEEYQNNVTEKMMEERKLRAKNAEASRNIYIG